MKRVYLITGANGYLAKTTMERLRRQDCLIRGLILPGEPGTDDDVITYYTGDITRPETLDPFFSGLENMEVIVLHMAAAISIQKAVSAAVYAVNVTGTQNIIEQCLRHQVSRLLYVSSTHAIPVPDKKETITEVREFSEKAVEGAYAKTKAEATQLVLDAEKEVLSVVVVHPSAIFGPGEASLNQVTQFMQMYLDHHLPVGIKGGYDFVDVRDVADGIVSAIDNGKSGECYLLTNRYVSIAELLEYMGDATGRKKRTVCYPMWLAKTAALFAGAFATLTGSRPAFTKYALEIMESDVRFSHKKADLALFYHPRDTKETVSDTLEYIAQHPRP